MKDNKETCINNEDYSSKVSSQLLRLCRVTWLVEYIGFSQHISTALSCFLHSRTNLHKRATVILNAKCSVSLSIFLVILLSGWETFFLGYVIDYMLKAIHKYVVLHLHAYHVIYPLYFFFSPPLNQQLSGIWWLRGYAPCLFFTRSLRR